MKISLWACAFLLSSVAGRAITSYDIDYQQGVNAGVKVAADYIDSNAPDWTTDFTVKSDAEFQLIALEQSSTLASMGTVRVSSRYRVGLAAGIQDYIDLMNSVGEPVWFTGSSTTVASETGSTRLLGGRQPNVAPATDRPER